MGSPADRPSDRPAAGGAAGGARRDGPRCPAQDRAGRCARQSSAIRGVWWQRRQRVFAARHPAASRRRRSSLLRPVPARGHCGMWGLWWSRTGGFFFTFSDGGQLAPSCCSRLRWLRGRAAAAPHWPPIRLSPPARTPLLPRPHTGNRAPLFASGEWRKANGRSDTDARLQAHVRRRPRQLQVCARHSASKAARPQPGPPAAPPTYLRPTLAHASRPSPAATAAPNYRSARHQICLACTQPRPCGGPRAGWP